MRSRFAKDSLLSFMFEVALTVIALLTNVVTARWLGPEGRGGFQLVVTTMSMMQLLASLGIGPSIVYFVGRKQMHPEDAYTSSVLLASVLGTVGVTVFGLLFFFTGLGDLYEGVAVIYVMGTVSYLPLLLWIHYLNHTLLSLQRIQSYNLTSLLRGVGFPVLLLGMSLFVRDRLGAAIAARFVTWVIVLVLTLVLLPPFKLRPKDLQVRAVTRQLKYGARVSVSRILRFGELNGDVFLIKHFMNLESVGYYSIAFSAAKVTTKASMAVSRVLFPRVSNAEDDDGCFTALVLRNVIVVTLATGAVLAGIARWLIVGLFSQEYASSVRPFLWLIPGASGLAVQNVLTGDLDGRGHPEAGMYATLLSSVTTVGMDIWLIPHLGIAGAAIGSSCAYIAGAVLLVIYFSKRTGLEIKAMITPRVEDFFRLVSVGRAMLKSTGTDRVSG